jgi:hypothetical protein
VRDGVESLGTRVRRRLGKRQGKITVRENRGSHLRRDRSVAFEEALGNRGAEIPACELGARGVEALGAD